MLWVRLPFAARFPRNSLSLAQVLVIEHRNYEHRPTTTGRIDATVVDDNAEIEFSVMPCACSEQRRISRLFFLDKTLLVNPTDGLHSMIQWAYKSEHRHV